MPTRRLTIVLVLLGVTWPALSGLTPGSARPAESVSSSRAVSAALEPFVGKEIAGVATLVATNNRILERSAIGVSSLETHRTMRPDDIFWIASMSKPIAAIGVGILHDEGKLDFDDPISKYVPEFGTVSQLGERSVTIRQLLTHTGGLGEQMKRDPHLTLAQTAVMAAHQPVRNAVGARWSYSTLGIDVVSRVIEVASGQPLDRFMADRLFKPLGMKDIGFWVSAKNLNRLARSYRRVDEGALTPADIPYLYGTEPTDRGRPPLLGAGLFSTAPDIVRVYQMMLNGGVWHGRRILAASTVEELIRPQPGTQNARPGASWGLGFSIVQDPTASPGNAALSTGSFGHGGAYGTSIWADPHRKMVYVLMLQRAGLRNPDNSDMRIVFQKTAADTLLRDVR